MSNPTVELDRNPWPKAADYIEAHGWTKGTEVDDEGHVCMEGAVRLCAPQRGDGAIYREVISHRGKGASFNDADETTVDDVLGYLRHKAQGITDEELAEVFGPQWEPIVALVREAAAFTEEQRNSIYSAYQEAWKSSAFNSAWRAVHAGSVPAGAAVRALRAFGVGGGGAVVGAALARRHEIGSRITQKQYDLLTSPWVSVTDKPVHPDDVVAVAA